MQEAIRTRSKIIAEPLLEGLDESRRRRRIKTSRELFPSPETLLQPSPQGSNHNTENMENNNNRRTLADYTNTAGGNIKWKTPEEATEIIENMATSDNELNNSTTNQDREERVVVDVFKDEMQTQEEEASYKAAFQDAHMTSHQDEEPKVTGNHCLLFQVHKGEKIGRGGKVPEDWKKGRPQLGRASSSGKRLKTMATKRKEKEPEQPHSRNDWGKLATYPAPANIAVVKEFYTNAKKIGDYPAENYLGYVRGHAIRPRKAIDEAYYKQYCGGEEAAQPVPPRHARRERGQAQNQTSAETHEAEPFQMRDMFMSLIGAQLQSIHRGHVATAEMIVGMYDTPPAHRWTMEEFHNVVAWPEESVQGGGAEAAEASVREMEKDEGRASSSGKRLKTMATKRKEKEPEQPHSRNDWGKLATYPAPANIAVVKEFYTNAKKIGDYPAENYLGYVRGHAIRYDPDSINNFLDTVWAGHFQRNRSGSVVNIRRIDLTPLAKYWMAFSHANIEPCSHVSDITLSRALFIYCAIRNLNVNIGQVIADEISVCVNTSNNKAPLGHPFLITHLCKIAGVDTSVPPFERPRKAIDEAYYKQYCGGEEAAQPVPPRHARRERGQAQNQTSAETHEAEPFQMRDMFMSLIGAQLQSIHRGHVATAEMIVGMYDTPPAHRWTMEEFHNVVAWPEESVQGGGAEAAEASVREMEKDEGDDDDAFEDDEDEEEEEDTKDSSD
ncbi:hypothetical protein LR48_Vigan221s000600 [Vigna angularis]|uniref:Putative plant transposon protein domain-containing protein n=1 Tax=Phaseolus angularis TaxID=3914 RepID=A0A0L9T7G5_PHAAN|nr:hypothetical protein LR48_Vigan221s000600 [Vigna angularis]